MHFDCHVSSAPSGLPQGSEALLENNSLHAVPRRPFRGLVRQILVMGPQSPGRAEALIPRLVRAESGAMLTADAIEIPVVAVSGDVNPSLWEPESAHCRVAWEFEGVACQGQSRCVTGTPASHPDSGHLDFDHLPMICMATRVSARLATGMLEDSRGSCVATRCINAVTSVRVAEMVAVVLRDVAKKTMEAGS